MAFDPTLPVNGSQIVAVELRNQFNGLNDEIALLPTQAQLSNDLVNTQNATVLTVLPLTSNNSNGVSTLGLSSGDFEVQTVIDKLNELINALRR